MGIIDYIGDNASQIDAPEYEEKVREEDPQLLQHDENIIFAFKGRGGDGRDHYMLTTKRVLIRDKKGITGKRIRYSSVPYTSIRAFAVDTAGSVGKHSNSTISSNDHAHSNRLQYNVY